MSSRRPPEPPPSKTWKCRYSPSELLYLEMTPTGVKQYLDHAPHHAEHWTFEEVLAGKIDAHTRNLFDQQVLEELKAECRAKLAEKGGST